MVQPSHWHISLDLDDVESTFLSVNLQRFRAHLLATKGNCKKDCFFHYVVYELYSFLCSSVLYFGSKIRRCWNQLQPFGVLIPQFFQDLHWRKDRYYVNWFGFLELLHYFLLVYSRGISFDYHAELPHCSYQPAVRRSHLKFWSHSIQSDGRA